MLKKFFDDYDSEEDVDYEPTAKENKEYENQHKRKNKGKRSAATNIHELYEEMKKEYEEEEKQKELAKENQRKTCNKLELASSILNSDSIKPNKRIIFAGKQYLINEETGQLEAIERKSTAEMPSVDESTLDEAAIEIRNRHISYQYLNHVMQAIYNRSKKINAVGKSKLDWKGFVRQEGIEDKLMYNRKGGVIQNMQFIKNTS